MNKKHLFQPLMRRLPDHGHDNYFIVNGYSQELLMKIRDMPDVFATIGDDHRHGLWIEVPRGKPSNWATFKEVRDCDEDVKTRKDYLEYWKSEFPRDTYWYFISVSQYKGHTYLYITDRDSHWCSIHDDANWNGHNMGPLDWNMEPLLSFLQERIAEIVQDTEAHNRYVNEHLPKRQRTGSIPRKEMNRIVPWQRRVPKQLEKGLQMLRECIANEAIYKKIKDGENPGALPPFYREPLDDSVYDLIRDEVSEPLTLCGIQSILERKYDVVLGISNNSDHQHCYLFEHGPGQLRIEENKRQFDTVNEAMHYIIRRFVEEKQKKQ